MKPKRRQPAPVVSIAERQAIVSAQLAAQVPTGVERTRQKLKLKTVFAFAFDTDQETAPVVDSASAYQVLDTAIQDFIRRHQAAGHSVGVFRKSEWF